MSDNQDVVSVILEKLSSPNITIRNVLLNVFVPQDSLAQNVIFSIIECQSSCALFIFQSEQKIPTKFSDLTIDKIIPIDEYFYCDTDAIPSSYTHERFVVNCKTLSLMFHIEIGSEDFKEEIRKAKEAFLSNSLDHKWLERFRHDSYLELGDEASGLPVSRQKFSRNQSTSSRESMLRFEMESRKAQYIKLTERVIFIGTWNVNGQPPPENVSSWLSCDEDPPILYAVGFQELDLSKEAFLFNDTPREAEWEKVVANSIHPRARYRRIALERLVGIQLIVLIHTDHYNYVRDIASDTVGTGILGKMGNKGGVAIRLKLYNTTLCFVCSHLAAHQEELERRNQDYKDINDRINFKKPPLKIKDHDQVYWLGDLNYRLHKSTCDEVMGPISYKQFDSILRRDQLMMEKDEGRVFEGYSEAEIMFPPTYKFELNTDKYDVSEKTKAPAWTDRILFKGKGIYPTVYRSHMDLRTSDHKPVSARFRADIAVIDEVKQKRVQEEVFKLMDKLENEILPQVTVDTTEVSFGLVKYREPTAKEIIVANTGQVPVEFNFVNKINEDSYCKDWLRILPNCGSIEPGEKCDIRLEVNLEHPLTTLEDILVLHLENGKDIFISVTGNCQRSCFTTAISLLCRAHVPILCMTESEYELAEKEQSSVLYSVPRELWLLVDFLYRHGLKSKLFESKALPDEVIKVRDWLDNGHLQPNPIENVCAAAECLLLFLQHTKDPVVPHYQTEQIANNANNFTQCQELIRRLPDLHRNVFLYIMMFLKELLKYSRDNMTDAKTLATIFGAILLRSPRGKVDSPAIQRAKCTFVHHFLVNDISSLIMPQK